MGSPKILPESHLVMNKIMTQNKMFSPTQNKKFIIMNKIMSTKKCVLSKHTSWERFWGPCFQEGNIDEYDSVWSIQGSFDVFHFFFKKAIQKYSTKKSTMTMITKIWSWVDRFFLLDSKSQGFFFLLVANNRFKSWIFKILCIQL